MMENSERELLVRIAVCKFCIRVLENCKDDPRQPSALEHYKWQLAQLESRLPHPPDRVVGLQPAKLIGTVPKLK